MALNDIQIPLDNMFQSSAGRGPSDLDIGQNLPGLLLEIPFANSLYFFLDNLLTSK